MNINWKIRLKSLPFWAGMLSALVVFGQSVAPLFGLTIDFGPIQDAVNAILMLLVAWGVLVDPTTPKTTDSQVSQEKRSIDESAEEVIARTLSNDDLAEILSRVTTKEKE